MHKRKEVKEKTRKKCSWQTCGIKERNEGAPKNTGCTKKTQENRVGITFPLIDSDGGVSTIPVQERFYKLLTGENPLTLADGMKPDGLTVTTT